jgi:hypothetical protein
MSKKNGAAKVEGATTIQLSVADFDRIDEIEPIELPSESEAPAVVTETLPAETEELVLSTVVTFDAVFETDPLKADYFELAQKIKAEQDSTDKAIQFIEYGRLAYNIMVKRKNIAPNAFERAAEMKRLETALLMNGITEWMVKPQEVTALYWLAKLDRSTTPPEGEARSYPVDATPDEWFGGNITVSTLRVLAKCIKKVSGKKELDTWEFAPHFEAHVREWIIRLREGYLSMRQVEQLISHRKTVIANEKTAAEYAGLNDDQIASIEASKKNKHVQGKLEKLGSLALGVQDYAATELKQSGSDLRDFLVNKQIIPPVVFPTNSEIASHLTPGDAKEIVQHLVRQYKLKPDRLKVFKSFYQTTKAIVAEMQSAQGKQQQQEAAAAEKKSA